MSILWRKTSEKQFGGSPPTSTFISHHNRPNSSLRERAEVPDAPLLSTGNSIGTNSDKLVIGVGP